MFLQDIQGFRKGNLKKTSGTTITRKDGSKYVENITESGIESTELDMSFVVFVLLNLGITEQRDEEIRFPIEVKKTNLLKDLKEKILTEILEQESSLPLYLYHSNGTLLEEDEKTLESLGITFMSTLLLDLSKSDIWKSSPKIQNELTTTVSKMPLFIELDVYKFNHKTNKWEVYQNTENSQIKNLSIVTYNIWFSNHHFEKRCKALLGTSAPILTTNSTETLKQCDSDFICLQEVLPQFLEKLLLEPWVRDNYFLSDSEKFATVEPYGDILLSKHPISKLRLYDLPTQMSRRFVVAELLINNEKIKVGTVHLESLGFSELRSQQLKMISKVLGTTTCKYAFLVGDTNICGTSKENASIPVSFVDMWPTLNKENPGWTCGIAYPDEDTRNTRIDRILFRNHETNAKLKWMPKTIELIGNTPFEVMKTEENKEEVLYPSDHFGLFGKYEYVS